MLARLFLFFALTVIGLAAEAEFSSGSDGSDGAFSPTVNVTIDMADHPDGIYNYTSVNIPSGVTVGFVPNQNNSPVVWLIQSTCVISGTIWIGGSNSFSSPTELGKLGGPGGYSGGRGPLGAGSELPEPGSGPGGGKVDVGQPNILGGNASFGTQGEEGGGSAGTQHPAGEVYGNFYLLPLIGGSGGGGGVQGRSVGGAGGGGAILIVAGEHISLTGKINAYGGSSSTSPCCTAGCDTRNGGGGGGSGGGVRLVSAQVKGNGLIDVTGGVAAWCANGYKSNRAGVGRIRIDAQSDLFTGSLTSGAVTRGFQNIFLLPDNTLPSLRIAQVAGFQVPANPSGLQSTPDVSIPSDQAGPLPVVVSCANVPVGTPISVSARTATAGLVSATATNTGTLASSTATVYLDLPRGSGTLMAKTTVAIAPTKAASAAKASFLQTGLAANGERFTMAEISTELGGESALVYVTESGTRIPITQ